MITALTNLPGVRTKNGQIDIQGRDNIMVLINGEQRSIESLRKIRTSEVDSVVLIENMSAKFGSEYSAVLSITTQRNANDGLSVDINISGYTQNKYNFSDIGLKRGYKNVVLYAGYNLFLRKSLTTEEKNIVSDNYQSTTKDHNSNRLQLQHYFNYGIDYFINPNNTLCIHSDYNLYTQNTEYSRNRLIYDNELQEKQMSAKQSLYDKTGHNYSLFFKNISRDKLRTFSFSANVYQAEIISNEISKSDFVPQLNADYRNKAIQNSYRVNVDFTKQITSKFGLDIGSEYYRRNISHTVFYDETIDDQYTENRFASYANFSAKLNKMTCVVGIRLEQKMYAGGVRNQQIERYLSPNIAIDMPLLNKKKLNFHYIRKIYEPSYSQISSLPLYDDATKVFVGSPNLKPYSIDGLTATFSKKGTNYFVKTSVFSNIYQDLIKNYTTFSSDRIEKNNSVNLDLSYQVGAKISISADLFELFSINPSFYATYNSFDYADMRWNGFSYNFRVSPELILKNDISVGAEFEYSTTSTVFQGTNSSTPFVNFFIQKSLFDEDGSILIGFNPFNDTYKSVINDENLYVKSIETEYYKSIYVEFSYYFCKGKEVSTATKNTFYERIF